MKEIYRWKEDRFVFFMKKIIGPRITSSSRKNQTKVVRKTEDDVNHFHQGGHPRAKAGTCDREVHQPSSLALTATLSHVVAQSMISH